MRLALAASRRTARSGFGEESSPSHLRGLYKRGFTRFELALSNTEGQHTKCMQMLCYGISRHDVARCLLPSRGALAGSDDMSVAPPASGPARASTFTTCNMTHANACLFQRLRTRLDAAGLPSQWAPPGSP